MRDMRNVKILSFPSHYVVSLFENTGSETISLFKYDDVPEDCIVTGIRYDFITDSFLVKLFHESFPEVIEGQEPMTLNNYISVYNYKLEGA